MANERVRFGSRLNQDWLERSARTAIAVLLSLLLGRLLRMPETYWAAITAVVVMQSTLRATLTTSGQRLVGTALGAVAGALLAAYFGTSIYACAASVFLLGLVCAILGTGKSSYRFAGITLAIVMLVPFTNRAWVVALHRFVEVSLGIAVGLAVTAVWPERERQIA
jgi:uncharacterized membrane protein YgaE (UPF0421/DUF939 family)